MKPVTVNDVLVGAAGKLNDSAQSLFTNAAMLPHYLTAYDELLEMLEENNVPITNEQSASFLIPQGVIDIGGDTGPAFPLDMVEIQSCWERLQGSTSDFILMVKKTYLPLTQILTSNLQFWSLQGQAGRGLVIKFLGANTNREVKLNYICNILPPQVDEKSLILINNAKTTLVYRTAALSAEFIGENKTRADSLNGMATAAFDRLANIMIKGQQSITTRRRPFRSGYKMRNYYTN